MITQWSSYKAPRGVRVEVPFSPLFERFRTPKIATSKESVGGWGPAVFRGDYRNLASHEASFGVGLDVEKGESDFEITCTLWKLFWCFVHTTFSHTPDAPRLRVIFPLSRPASKNEAYSIHAWLTAQSERAGQLVDPATKDPSRFWYLPSHPPGAEYRWAELTGEVLDVDGVLRLQKPRESAPVARVIPLQATGRTVDRARRYLDMCDPAIQGQHGSTQTFLVAMRLVRGFLLSEQTAYELMTSWNQRCLPPWSEKDLRRKIHEAATKGNLPEGHLLNARGRHAV